MPRTHKPSAADALPLPSPHQNYRPALVAEYTGLSRRYVYEACERGDIRHIKLGRAVMVPGVEVLRLLGLSAA